MIGIKSLNDVCDFRYECLSRCCVNGRCGEHVANCRKFCLKNEDCESGCCGESHCTLDIVCEGNKVNSDYCDKHEECVSKLCRDKVCYPKSKNKHHCLTNNECFSGYCEDNVCQDKQNINELYQKLITTILVFFAMIIVIMGIIFWL